METRIQGINPDFMEGSVKTYGVAIRELTSLFRSMFDDEPVENGGFPKQRFQFLISQFEKKGMDLQKLANSTNAGQEVKDLILDERYLDIDDFTPNQLWELIWSQARSLCHDDPTDVLMTEFLRPIYRELPKIAGTTKGMHVGRRANRHFWRVLQYLREAQEATTWTDGNIGLKIMNASGRGAVAEFPDGPDKLKIRLNSAYF